MCDPWSTRRMLIARSAVSLSDDGLVQMIASLRISLVVCFDFIPPVVVVVARVIVVVVVARVIVDDSGVIFDDATHLAHRRAAFDIVGGGCR